jgi:hypothetical protein
VTENFSNSQTGSPLAHFAARLREAEVVMDPYPHYYVENVFPDDYYRELLAHLPASAIYQNLFEVTTLKLDHFRHRDQRAQGVLGEFQPLVPQSRTGTGRVGLLRRATPL